jgi:hypothetical protein
LHASLRHRSRGLHLLPDVRACWLAGFECCQIARIAPTRIARPPANGRTSDSQPNGVSSLLRQSGAKGSRQYLAGRSDR